MQNYAQLIGKLQIEFANNATPEQLYVTAVQLQQSLYQSVAQPSNNCGSKVSVLLPNCYMPKTIATELENKNNIEIFEKEELDNVPFSSNKLKYENNKVDIIEKSSMVLVDNNDDDDDDDVITLMSAKTTVETIAATIPKKGVLFFNDADSDSGETENLAFNNFTITDLKKNISLHEKFIFINELFRGDDSNYDRSIRTIQNFDNFTEAKNWIVKELFTKEGWNDESETVVHFMDLIKRRFAS